MGINGRDFVRLTEESPLVNEEPDVAVNGFGAGGWRGETGRREGPSNDDRPSVLSSLWMLVVEMRFFGAVVVTGAAGTGSGLRIFLETEFESVCGDLVGTVRFRLTY